ncbi:hypothetical protein ElyMa_000566200 [Elysia marginata]|uniref:Uncharacterized protein n=1 Tax=Elysia marginata TaxID=1093978 RepID=A0AAV4G4J6_9GAST|nr:hypothetical protein ElyMa_000566200 [Elysia marginata]
MRPGNVCKAFLRDSTLARQGSVGAQEISVRELSVYHKTTTPRRPNVSETRCNVYTAHKKTFSLRENRISEI